MLGLFKKEQQPATSAIRRSTRPRSVEKQVNLKALKGEELDKWLMRLSWMYATGTLSEDDLNEIIAANVKGEIVNVDMDESLFASSAKFEFNYTDADAKEPEEIPYNEWVELSKREKDAHSFPLIYFSIEDRGVDEFFDGSLNCKEGAMALKFAKAFWALAAKFTDYELFEGKRSYTGIDRLGDFMPKNNKIPEVTFGTNDKAAYLTLAMDLSPDKLSAMEKQARREYLAGIRKLLEAATAEVVAAARHEFSAATGTSKEASTDDDKMSVLDYLTKIAATWKKESSRINFEKKVKAMRGEGMSDEAIIEAFKLSNWWDGIIKDIESALKDGKDPLEGKVPKDKPEQPKDKTDPPKDKPRDKKEGKGGKQDPPKRDKAGSDDDKGGKGADGGDAGNDGETEHPYEADAMKRTAEEWKVYFYTDARLQADVKGGFFKDLKAEVEGQKPKISIFEMAAYYAQHEKDVPACVGEEIKAEIARIEAKRAAQGGA